MARTSEAQTDRCPSADVLLRYARGDSDREEAAAVKAHAATCERCGQDLASVEFLGLEMLVSEFDRAELETFRPTRLCRELTVERLAKIKASAQPPDADTYHHLHRCAYCRQRFLLPQFRGRMTLRDRITRSLLESSLEMAEAKVKQAAALWAPGGILAEVLRACRDKRGSVVPSGLQGFLRRPAPVYETTGAEMGVAEESLEAPAAEPATWEIPILETGVTIIIELEPGEEAGNWAMTCRVDADDEARIPEGARIEIHDEAGAMSYAGDVRQTLKSPVKLSAGTWQLKFALGEDVRVLKVSLG
ncbi:MAG TPA: hypothetical protein VMZ92_05180 [Planctomycetota bacterium]|nr:hypothetical protein [Planctomycetota bacterium]